MRKASRARTSSLPPPPLRFLRLQEDLPRHLGPFAEQPEGLRVRLQRQYAEAFRLLRERSEEHTSELQSPDHLVCRLLLEKKNKKKKQHNKKPHYAPRHHTHHE